MTVGGLARLVGDMRDVRREFEALAPASPPGPARGGTRDDDEDEGEGARAGARWEVAIPGWRPASTNELLRSVRERIAHKKRDRDHVSLFARVAGVPAATGKRRVSLRVTLPWGRRRWDVDALWKSLLDACTWSRLIVDDRPEWCELGPVEYRRGEALETVIILEDVDDDRA